MKSKRRQKIDNKGQLRTTSTYDIEVDSSSEEDLKLLLAWTKNMLGNMRANNGERSKNLRMKEILDSCMKIYNADITHLYDEGDDAEKKYYVYAHCDPTKSIAIGKHGITTFAATLGMKYRPFYIGMGNGDRAYDLDRNETHRKYRQQIKQQGLDIDVHIISQELSRSDALALESKLIDIFGLIVKKGSLVNLDEGKKHKERRTLYENELTVLGRVVEYK